MESATVQALNRLYEVTVCYQAWTGVSSYVPMLDGKVRGHFEKYHVVSFYHWSIIPVESETTVMDPRPISVSSRYENGSNAAR